MAIIPIAFSYNPITLNKLKKRFNVIVPSSITETFTLASRVVKELLEKNNSPLVIHEVGGYLAAHTDDLSQYKHFLGIVEGTNNGLWNYEKKGYHQCPILTIAESPLKDIEAGLIGDGIVYSLERILREEFKMVLQGEKSAVIGFGRIGSSAATALRGRESCVSVYDINPVRNIYARFEGYNVLTPEKILCSCSVIVGCTGVTSILAEHIALLKPNASLVSGSSKTIEFDLDGFKRICEIEEVSDVVQRYIRDDGTSFFLLAKGTPVNFRDKSVLGSVLDLIYSEAYICLRELINGNVPPGLNRSFPYIHQEVASVWMKYHNQ